MKSPLADLYSSGPVPGDQETVFNTSIPDSDSSTMQPVQEEEEGELTGSELETPQETEPSVSDDQSYREIIRGIRAYMNWNFVSDLEVSLLKKIPLLVLDLSRLEKYQSNYQRMTGSVVSGSHDFLYSNWIPKLQL